MDRIVLYEKKENCCACGACVNVCPKHAISMVEDEYGFMYPYIDATKCVRCGACKNVCAYQHVKVENNPIAAYVAVNKNEEMRLKSASGGIFAAMATKILDEGGVVIGATLDRIEGRFVPHHIVVTDKEKLYKLQGSKYVQSATENTYQECLEYLRAGKKVLYSGTPCQIAGLYGFLRKDYTNLITVDLICHGVPNAKFFNDYLLLEAKKRRCTEVIDYVFRDKIKGWGMNGRLDYICQDGKKKSIYIPARLASYNTLFLDGLIYRENCYSCKYACESRPGDVTIGDYWGIEEEHPQLVGKGYYNEKLGISCIIVNSDRGMEFCDNLSGYIQKDNSTFKKIAKKNGQLNKPSRYNEKREYILMEYCNKGYIAIDQIFRNRYRKQRIIHSIYNMIPRGLRLKIKKYCKIK